MNKDQKAKEWRELKAAEAAFFRSLQFLSERVRRARRESLVCRAQFWGGRSAARLDSHLLLPRFPVVSMAVNRRASVPIALFRFRRELVFLFLEKHVERRHRAVTTGDVLVPVEFVCGGKRFTAVNLLLQHPKIVSYHDNLMEEDLQLDFLFLKILVRRFQNQFAAAPARRKFPDDGIRFVQSKLVNNAGDDLFDELSEGNIQAGERRLRFRGLNLAGLRRKGTLEVVELNVNTLLGDRRHNTGAVLRVPDLLADVECFNFHCCDVFNLCREPVS